MTTLITGATSGIGESLAKLYADNNEQVIACGRNTEKLAKLSQHQNIESCQFDATDLQDIRSSTYIKIINHRDYFDVGAMLYRHIPVLGSAVKYIDKRASA